MASPQGLSEMSAVFFFPATTRLTHNGCFMKSSSFAILVLGLFAGWFLWSPNHTHHGGVSNFFAVVPDAGYNWENSSSAWNKEVAWSPLAPDPSHRNIVAGQGEGTWTPADGFRWADMSSIDQDNRDYGSIADVVWQPGLSSRSNPHTSAADTEQQFHPDPGYDWVDAANVSDFAVVWHPGGRDARAPNMSAGTTEGAWIADNGYHIVTRENHIYAEPDSSTQTSSDGEQRFVNVVGHIIGASAASSCSNDQAGDGLFAQLAHAACRAVRDDQIKKAAAEVMRP
jgi:hypothetical protein